MIETRVHKLIVFVTCSLFFPPYFCPRLNPLCPKTGNLALKIQIKFEYSYLPGGLIWEKSLTEQRLSEC